MSSAGGEEDKKPAGGEGGIHINLKVKGQVCTPVPPPPLPTQIALVVMDNTFVVLFVHM
jgi:hypothetical protein